MYGGDPDHEPPIEPEPLPMQELRQEVDALRWEKYRLLKERANDNPRELAELALYELSVADYFASDGAGYVRRVQELQQTIYRHVEVLKSQGGGRVIHFDGRVVRDVDMIWRDNASKLVEQLRWVYQSDRLSHDDEHPDWSEAELLPLWTALMNHPEPKIAVLGCLALSSVESHRDAAIRRGIEVLPEVDKDGVALCAQIRKHLGRTEELDVILEGVIARAEAAKSPAELTHRRDLILALFDAIAEDHGNWRTRIDTLLSSNAVAPGSSLARDATFLREWLDRQAWRKKPAPNTALGFELSGAWAEYHVRIVEPEHPYWNRGLWPNLSSNHPRETDDPWVYFVDSDQQLLIGKIHLADGQVDTIARTPWLEEGQAFGRPVTVASDSNVLYIMTGRPGIARVDLKTKQVREWGVADGFVGEKITTMAILRSKVYMGMGGGISEFDPATQKFRLLASTSAVEKRSPLDGRDSIYGIVQMVSDPRADCLWIHVGAASQSGLSGIWQYSPAEGKFQKRVDTSKRTQYANSNLTWFHNDLFFLSTNGWQVLDTQTGVAAVLDGYANYGFSTPTHPVFLRVGDHIVQRCGRVYTPDGKVHDLGLPYDWLNLLPTRQGFIAHRSLNQKTQLLVFTRNETPPNQ
ncbi:MAG: hypothetical protein ABI614_22590 [Planctomycetota bacterium]